MLEGIILGLIQGIAEWLPVSSEGLIVLTQVYFFQVQDFSEIVKSALFLHLGTFLAAMVYFRREVWQLLKSASNYKKAEAEQKLILKFLVIATLLSGVLGYGLIKILENITIDLENFSRLITALIAILLFVTAGLQIKSKDSGNKTASNISRSDSIWLGIAQGLAALPGLSRSGLTVATLLLRKYDKTWALKLSFLMSLPIVFAGNIILNYDVTAITATNWWGLVFSFISGLVTIDLLLRLAKKINFGYFVLVFAILTLFAVFI